MALKISKTVQFFFNSVAMDQGKNFFFYEARKPFITFMNRSRINEAWIKVLLFPTYCIEGEDHLIHKQRAYLDLILQKIAFHVQF